MIPQSVQDEMKKMDRSVIEILTTPIDRPHIVQSAKIITFAIREQCNPKGLGGGSRRRRRPRSIQRGGDPHMADWVKCAYMVITVENTIPFIPVHLYTLVVFANIIKLLKLDQESLDKGNCEQILGIIRSKLGSKDFLGAYIQSCLVTNLTMSQEELARVAAKEFLVYQTLTQLDNFIQTMTGNNITEILAFIVPNIITVASYLVTMPTTISSVSGIALLGIVHGYFFPDPAKIQWTFAREADDVSRTSHLVGVVSAVAHNRFLATKNLFLATIKQIANFINFARQSSIVARQILDDPIVGVPVACRAIADKTLASMSSPSEADTLHTLSQLSQSIHEILVEIGKLPRYTDKVRAVLQMNIHCTSEDLRAVHECKLTMSPDFKAVADQVNAVNEAAAASSASISTSPTMAAAAAAAASASTSPVGAAAAAVVPTGVSHPQGVKQMMGPYSSSIPRPPMGAKGGIVRLDPSHDANAMQSAVQSVIGVDSRPRRAPTRWGPPLSRKGGSSKHKKKHPRSTNKRKLLVKRIRRRSMKHKKKGKW